MAKEGAAPRVVWIRQWERGKEFLEHRDGRPWHDVPMPPEEGHRCAAQTRTTVHVNGLPLMPIKRCACGATDLGDGYGWIDKHSRIK